MILSLRQIKNRIRSIESTKKITRAMEMISASKLPRAKDLLFATRPYQLKLASLLSNLAAGQEAALHPLLEKRQHKNNIALCVITSDTGLCSTYNYKVIHCAENFIKEHASQNIKIIAIGRKGYNYFKKKQFEITHSYLGLQGRYSIDINTQIEKVLTDLFLSQAADEVYIAYTKFKSALRHEETTEKILEIEHPQVQPLDYILEPNAKGILNDLVPHYFFMKIKLILLESFVAEHSARMLAMRTATDNAEELMEDFILLRNKARQTAITKEIIEVTSTVEALRE
ncbi:MAG TPA: ATP synthase F1 subunit gamma [Candidatus Omnitrophota bacterium]|nr:ATP synthase F1 subunit gamma [Candidatus Omnitrophota bacterium]HPD85441.1 ATP synthase F1 subunit gamma [Candidatus Omnitrophota bacterium]HRZ04058.1 ATP synthase F1 subunit gamma [Candidatus Omnitrophota bacterium]